MAYRTRSIRRTARKSSRRFLLTIILIIFLIYASIAWILPYSIEGLSFLNSSLRSPKIAEKAAAENPILAPPVFNLPFEATNTAKIIMKGYSAPNAEVKIYLDDELKETIKVSSDGSFLAENFNLVLGTNNIFGKTVDSNNTESLQSKTLKIIYDNEKPALNISEPSDGQITQEDKIKISGKTDSDTQAFVNNNRVIVNSEGSFNTIIPLTEGENSITIKSQDQAGNYAEASIKVTYQK